MAPRWLCVLVGCVTTACGASTVGTASQTTATSTLPSPLGVDGITAAQLASHGIYLGPPGTVPAGVPSVSVPIPPTTIGSGGPTSGVGSDPMHLAVLGDPANGKAVVDARTAAEAALKNVGGFVGPVTTGTPQLVQFVNIYTQIVATAWAIPMSGTISLSAGPVGTNGAPLSPGILHHTTVLAFVDAVTGQFISEEGFS